MLGGSVTIVRERRRRDSTVPSAQYGRIATDLDEIKGLKVVAAFQLQRFSSRLDGG